MAHYQQQMTVFTLSEWVGISRSTFYYRPRNGKPGVRPSTTTRRRDGASVPNEQVVQDIRIILSMEFCSSYGYEMTTAMLRNTTYQYIINEKKVYRLMRENKLLLNRRIIQAGPRRFASFRTIEACYAMEYLCMDIKYIWVEGEKRNCYLLTVEDVFSRKAIDHILGPSIRKKDVIALLKRIDRRHIIRGVIIRNDNGPQFIAHLVKNFLRLAEVRQEFTHPGTPEENAYIEAFHSILQQEVIDRYPLAGYYQAKETIGRYIQHYNNARPHRSLGWLTPEQKWQQGLLLRPTHASVNKNTVKDQYLCLEENFKSEPKISKMNLNLSQQSVQIIGG